MAAIELVSRAKSFGGFQNIYRHISEELGCAMKFSIYEPPGCDANGGEKFNVLFYLSGLTCTEENFIFKSGFQQYASEAKLIVVGPDTSPRGLNLPGEKDLWNFGEGAGAYLDALEEPWAKNYRMYSYVTKELPNLIQENFPTTGRFGIFGHSMGGHGAIVCGLRNPELFQSISAFAPITSPTNTEWGRDIAFKKYLGDQNQTVWPLYDSCEVAAAYSGPPRHILVDQGLNDEFIDTLLKPSFLEDVVSHNPRLNLELRYREGYNHSYYFVSTFIQDHILHHAKILGDSSN